ncbi:hypothetical protein P2Q00_06950 [Streptomyces coacervatus]|uniref:hypothetical protein n=1 Tax=Streptomyces coacervatus TaxID=647381 RepID=UPI0023DB9A98|nr:hypothetical protein [Streptomyces coacervatus]MDF2265180.1 hypothetical protein [Streptomyces coacervatus]
MDRAPGLSVRLKLTLSYAGFLMVAGFLLLAAVWLLITAWRPVRRRYSSSNAAIQRTVSPGVTP